jgi:hypothetical protein
MHSAAFFQHRVFQSAGLAARAAVACMFAGSKAKKQLLI